MRTFILLAVLAAPGVAFAQSAPEMVLMPKGLIEAARSWIGHPDATTAVQIYAALEACEASNAEKPPAHDGCAAVTAAIKARRDALAEASKTPKNEKPSP